MKYCFYLFILFVFNLNSYSDVLEPFSLPIYSSKEQKTYRFPESMRSKKLVINFWAEWCTSCIQELPELEKLKEDNPDVEFIAINAGDSLKKLKRFFKKYKFSYLILQDKDRSFSKSVGVRELPRTLLVDKKGKILYSGNRPPKKL